MSVSSYDAGVQRRSRRYGVAITIEGIGDRAGIWYLCSHVPDWARDSAQWKRWLCKPWPSSMSERPPELGGVSESGDLEATLLDPRLQDIDGVPTDGLLTDQIRTEAESTTWLGADVLANPTDDIIQVEASSALPVGTVMHCGAEAMLVTRVNDSTHVTVTRGWLGTEVLPHDGPPSTAEKGDAVRIRTGFIRGRRARVYKYPLDGEDSSTLREVGLFFIDAFDVTEDFTGYMLRGKSQASHLSRSVSRIIRSGEFTFYKHGSPIDQRDDPDSFDAYFAGEYGLSGQWSDVVFLKVGDEVLSGTPPPVTINMRRGLCGTERTDDHSQNVPCTEVFVAENDPSSLGVLGSFRYSPGPSPSTSRLSGTWTASSHWIDILLCLLTSSAEEEDLLELLNYRTVATAGVPSGLAARELSNWSSLPPGIGVGLPASQIDVLGMLAVKDRTPDALFPSFYCGDETVKFGELITEKILKPLGAYLTYSGGLAQVVLPRMPLAGDGTFTIGSQDILQKTVGKGRVMPQIRVTQDFSRLVGRVTLKTRTSDGAEVSRSKIDSDFRGTYGQRGLYTIDGGELEIDASAARASKTGDVPWLEQHIAGVVFRFRRPPLKITCVTHDTLYSVLPGDVGRLTLDEIPHPITGRRGVEDMAVEVLGVEESLAGKGELTLDLLGYPMGVRIGRIAPSARSTGSSASGGDTAVTVEANRYTCPDAGDGLPTTDAEAFTEGDVVQVRDSAGVASGSTRTVVSIAGNVITLSGSTAVGSGNAICYCTYLSETDDQKTDFCSMADGVTHLIGAIAQPFHYGEN